MVKLNPLILNPKAINPFGKQSTDCLPQLGSRVQPQYMKAIFTLHLLLISIFGWSQIAETIVSHDFEAISNNKLLVRFAVPDAPPDYYYNIHSAHVYSRNSSKTAIKSISGDTKDLQSGMRYQIIWEVLQDTDELDGPERVEIHLSYTAATKRKHEEAQEKETVLQIQKAEEYAAHEEYNAKRIKRKNYPFLTLGGTVTAGYVHAMFKEMPEDMKHRFGLGYGFSAFTELHLGGDTYLQVEGAYVSRRFYYNHQGEFVIPGECSYQFNTQDAHFTFNDYRIYTKLKLGAFVVGGYYSFLQSAKRDGDIEYLVACQDPPGVTGFASDEFAYNLLDPEHYPADRNGDRAVTGDYGLTLGFETLPRNNVVFGIGVDMSLSNLINNQYELWTTENAVELQPADAAELRLGYAYVKLGLRL